MTNDSTVKGYSALIGDIVVEWGRLEFICDHALAGILGISHFTGRAITVPVAGFSLRMDILQSVSKERITDQAVLKELNQMVSHIRDLSSKRNNIVHALWGTDSESSDAVALRFKKSKLPKALRSTYSKDRLKSICEEIKQSRDELAQFLAKNDLLPPDALIPAGAFSEKSE